MPELRRDQIREGLSIIPVARPSFRWVGQPLQFVWALVRTLDPAGPAFAPSSYSGLVLPMPRVRTRDDGNRIQAKESRVNNSAIGQTTFGSRITGGFNRQLATRAAVEPPFRYTD